jgi:hypothetical protein
MMMRAAVILGEMGEHRRGVVRGGDSEAHRRGLTKVAWSGAGGRLTASHPGCSSRPTG